MSPLTPINHYNLKFLNSNAKEILRVDFIKAFDKITHSVIISFFVPSSESSLCFGVNTNSFQRMRSTSTQRKEYYTVYYFMRPSSNKILESCALRPLLLFTMQSTASGLCNNKSSVK